MKIELECPNCNSMLRLGTEHAGKQVRCPVCGTLSPIPELPEPAPPRKPEPSGKFSIGSINLPHEEHAEQPRYTPPVEPEPVYTYTPPPTQFEPYTGREDELNGYGVASIVFGALAFIASFSCVCVSPILSFIGIVFAFQSRGKGRTIGLGVNLAACLAWLLMVAILMFAVFF